MLRVKKIGLLIALIFSIHIEFLNLLFLDKFTTVLLALPLLSLTTSLSSTVNTFEVKCDNFVILNRKINNTVILLKS